MTTPRVIELPRRREPAGRDTFLGGVVIEFPRAAARPDNVVALRPRDGRGPDRPLPPVPPLSAA